MTPAESTADEPITLTDEQIQPPDSYFEHVMLLVEALGKDAFISVTLLTGGGALTGKLIPYEAWQELVLSQFDGATATFNDASGTNLSPDADPRAFAQVIARSLRILWEKDTQQYKDMLARLQEADEVLPARQFVHLKDATFIMGESTLSFPVWRGRIDRISGWMLGAYTA